MTRAQASRWLDRIPAAAPLKVDCFHTLWVESCCPGFCWGLGAVLTDLFFRAGVQTIAQPHLVRKRVGRRAFVGEQAKRLEVEFEACGPERTRRRSVSRTGELAAQPSPREGGDVHRPSGVLDAHFRVLSGLGMA